MNNLSDLIDKQILLWKFASSLGGYCELQNKKSSVDVSESRDLDPLKYEYKILGRDPYTCNISYFVTIL